MEKYARLRASGAFCDRDFRTMLAATTCLFTAGRDSPASLLTPFLYTQLLWATLLGWRVCDHFPDLPVMLGMLIIGAAGLKLAIRRRA